MGSDQWSRGGTEEDNDDDASANDGTYNVEDDDEILARQQIAEKRQEAEAAAKHQRDEEDEEDREEIQRMYAYRAMSNGTAPSTGEPATSPCPPLPPPTILAECPQEFPSRPVLLKPMLEQLKFLGIEDPEKHTWVGRDTAISDAGAEAVTMFCGCVERDAELIGRRANMIYADPSSPIQICYFPIFIGQCPRCGVIYWQLRDPTSDTPDVCRGTIEEIEEKIIEIVAEQMGVDKGDITRDTHFINDLNTDSLDTIELVMEFEDEFELSIPDEEAEKIQTVGQAIDYIKQNKT